MARVKLTDELKKAITGLSHKEKDKLLYRLIAKDKPLVDRLTFELIETEAGVTKEERRTELEESLMIYLNKVAAQYYSPGYLLLDIRHLSGEINRHVKTTKDKYGDIYLNFLMLNTSLRLLSSRIIRSSPGRSRTFDAYVVKRAKRLLNQVAKMHEDHRLDFEEAMQELGQHIQKLPNMLYVAEDLDLDVEVLLSGEV